MKKALAPFDERMEVPRYIDHTKEDLIKSQKEILANLKKRREQPDYDQDPEYRHNLEREIASLESKSDEELYQDCITNWEEDEIDPVTGGTFSTYNPNSKWDWYVIGGRWDKMIKTKDGNAVDYAFIRDIDFANTISCYGFLDHEGKWHEPGEMGWFGDSSTDETRNKLKEEFNAYFQCPDVQDKVLVYVDCHI